MNQTDNFANIEQRLLDLILNQPDSKKGVA
jgi:hypothetical protein